MDDLAAVVAAYDRVVDLIRASGVPVINAQASIGEPSTTLWLDVISEEHLLTAASTILETCAVSLVAACPAVDEDEDEEERSIILIGTPVIGLRFGVPAVDELDYSGVHNDDDGDTVELEETVNALRRAVTNDVASTAGVEPSNSARVHQLLESAITTHGEGDERAQRKVRSEIHLVSYEVEREIRRLHQRAFAHDASAIANTIITEDPTVLSMNKTTLRPHVYEHLRRIDHECATQRAGEPVVLAIGARAKAPKEGLF